MAGATRNIMVRAGADFSAITKQSQKAAQSMKNMSTSIASSAGLIKKALGAIGVAVSLSAIISAAKDAKEAYEEQAEAQAKLAQVMRNTMGASADEVKSIKALCDAQQKLGVIAGDVQMAGAQELATYLEQTSTLKKLIPVMNDMAAQQYGFNVTAESTASIATMLGKVMNGQVNALSRYGYKFDEAQEKILKFGNEEQRAAVLAQVVEQSVGGMNQALANTPTGRLKQLKNTMEDIKAQFGQAVTAIATAFLPLLMKVASVLSTIAKIATRVAQSIANVFGKKLEKGAAAVSTGAGTAAVNTQAMADALGDVEDKSKKAASAAKKAVRSLMGFDELNVLNSSDSGAGSSAADAVEDIGDALEDLSDEVSLGSLFDFGEAVEGFSWLENALANLKERVGPIIDDIKKIFGGLYDFIAGVFTGDWERAFNGLGSAVEGLGALVSDIISRLIVPAFDGLAGFVIERIGGLIDWIGEKTGLDLSKVKEVVIYGLNLVRYTVEATAIKIGWVVQDLANVVGAVIRGDWDSAWKAAQQLVHDASVDIIPTAERMAGEATQALLDAARSAETASGDADTAVQQAALDINAALDRVRSGAKETGEAFSEDLGETGTESANKFSGGFLEKLFEFNLTHMPGALGKIIGAVRTVLHLNQKQNEFYAAGEDSAEGFGDGMTDFWHSWLGIWLDETYGGLAAKVCELLKIGSPSKVFEEIGSFTSDGFLQGLSAGFQDITGFLEQMASEFIGLGGNLVESLQSGFSGLWNGFSSNVSNLVSTLIGGISNTIQTGFSGLGTAIGTAVSNAGSKLQELAGNARSSINTVLEDSKTSLNGIVSNIQGAVNSIISQANSILSRIRGRSYATGGFPEEGPFFMNRGEIAGKFSNGKSVVANNKQITDGIEEAAYRGFMRGMAASNSMGGGNEQPINVYVGNEKIYSGFTKWNRQQQLIAGGRA